MQGEGIVSHARRQLDGRHVRAAASDLVVVAQGNGGIDKNGIFARQRSVRNVESEAAVRIEQVRDDQRAERSALGFLNRDGSAYTEGWEVPLVGMRDISLKLPDCCVRQCCRPQIAQAVQNICERRNLECRWLRLSHFNGDCATDVPNFENDGMTWIIRDRINRDSKCWEAHHFDRVQADRSIQNQICVFEPVQIVRNRPRIREGDRFLNARFVWTCSNECVGHVGGQCRPGLGYVPSVRQRDFVGAVARQSQQLELLQARFRPGRSAAEPE